jgi:hypothetical protein
VDYAGSWVNTANPNGAQISMKITPCALSSFTSWAPGAGITCNPATASAITVTIASGWCPGGGICQPRVISLSGNFPVLSASENGVSSSFQVGVGIWIGFALSLLALF